MAETVCAAAGACDANWQPFPTLSQHAQAPGPTGFAYWDGFSWDGPDHNIGYFISGTGSYTGDPNSPQEPLPWWGNPDGSAVASFYFQSGGVAQTASLLEANGLWSPYDSLGWYDPNSASWGWIFEANGTTPAPQTVVFDPASVFGLFFVPDVVPGSDFNLSQSESYYTNDALNGIAAADVAYANANGIVLGPEDFQHFAVFQNGGGGYYIGVNDRSNQVGDLDYDDMIVTLAAVPEPNLAPLLVLVTVFLIWLARRRRISAN